MTSNSSAGRSISWELHPEPIQDYLLPPSFLPSQKETQKFSVAGQQYLEGMCIRNGRDYNLIKHINSIIYVCVCAYVCIHTHMGFPGGSGRKESAWNAGDLGSIPGSGRSPGEGMAGNSLQYSCLENPMARGARRLQSRRSQKNHEVMT